MRKVLILTIVVFAFGFILAACYSCVTCRGTGATSCMSCSGSGCGGSCMT